MKIIFTDHAKERMIQRGIKLSQIKDAIKNPTHILLSYPPTQKIQKIIRGKTLEIVYKTNFSSYVIITAYYL